METGLLEHGGWTFQGGREEIVIDERTEGWQVTAARVETTGSSAAWQCKWRTWAYLLHRRDRVPIVLSKRSRMSQKQLRILAEAAMAETAANERARQ